MAPDQSQRTRLESIDVVRGVIMIVMALDHTRDFFGITGQSPTNLATASTALFLTRWITHFCAPVFCLLTGTAAFLTGRKRSRAQLSRFLLTRGIWLILLELVVVRCLAYQFNVDYRVTMLLVLWSLGWSMIVLAALVWLPVPVTAGLGVLMITSHNLLDEVRLANPLWVVLHGPGFALRTPEHAVFAAYPLIPWIGVAAAGYGLGQLYNWESGRRRRFLLRTGLLVTAVFLVLRAVDLYGDPSHWRPQENLVRTILAFLNTTKQPPSLLYLSMTLGPALVLLSAVDSWTPRLLRPALTIGKVPLFYYVLHFALLHLLAVIVCYARYGSAHWMFESPDVGRYPFTPPPGWGSSLPVVYLLWAIVVMVMYPPCRWLAAIKQRRRDTWLSYI
jgi:uncharacterized membrane protein